MNDIAEEKTEPKKKFGFPMKFKKPGKQFFWAWIAYQAIKGTLTTTLIWVPILYLWWTS